jgi:hypothetical protein
MSAQVGGAFIGFLAAHAMFGLPNSSDVSSYATLGEGLGEVIATRWNLAKQRAGIYWWTDCRCCCCRVVRALVAQSEAAITAVSLVLAALSLL